jgi:hypothetical protein
VPRVKMMESGDRAPKNFETEPRAFSYSFVDRALSA